MNTPKKSEPLSEKQQSRRRALKIVGGAAVAVPVIETLTGRDLMNVTTQAQTVVPQGAGGAFGGEIGEFID